MHSYYFEVVFQSTNNKLDEQVVLSPSGRKEKPDKSNTAQENKKKSRHDGSEKKTFIACTHNTHNQCLAGTLAPEDLTYTHHQLYQTTDKVQQDATLLSYMTVSGVGRRRPKVGDVAKRNVRDYTIKYCVLNHTMKKIPVCKPSFMSIFGEYRANTFSISVILCLFLRALF